jgi:salicylate hydroxylase
MATTDIARIGDMRHVMSYVIAAGKSFNMVLSHPATSDPNTWKPGTEVEDVKKEFVGWDPRLVRFLSLNATFRLTHITQPRQNN